ncbi:dihydroorotase [Sediminibacterium sp.]|uniref:dihydroorotase n=1 Tax=Sediminibacterium sp. TaxID=1917865 RepID=UPI0025F9F78C|nr:dihydroorotase [Sediminibacterium sp.]MBW0178395.1 dihydroorotase [Sediminibacterium sp.]
MKILIRQAKIADTNASINRQVRDILIEDGIITQIAAKINGSADQEISADGLTVSPGWVDIFAHGCDPGFEYKETLDTLAAAAAAGGYTQVFALADNKPVTDNKAQVEYIRLGSQHLPASILPIGAITQKMEGNSLAEMYDMRNSGAVAFSDGLKPVQSPGLFLKALQYVKAFDGVLIQLPIDKSISAGGLINEGIVSTRLGLPGLPTLAEELFIKRDLDLLRYTGSKLHLTGISTANSVLLIQAAKAEGLAVTCSVTPYHLFFCDEDLQEYDTNLKVNPPLRSRADMLALRKAVQDGVIDCIASHHIPQDWDHKTCEFEYAAYGMLGLQTVFAVLNETIPGLNDEALVALLSNNARNIFGLTQTNIQEGAEAELTLFSRSAGSMLTKENLKSKSANTAFMNRPMKGAVLATIHKGQIHQP